MKTQTFKHFLSFIIIFVFPLYFSGCASFGPTKPNLPYAGKQYPSILIELAKKNPLLVQELGKLPELQDGISETEAYALRNIVELYNIDQANFENAFNEMYKIGLPEFRKYCSPLQALFWLAQKDIEETRRQLEYFHLESLLNASWDFQEEPFLTLSEQEAKKVINSIKSDEQKKEYYAFLDRIEVLNNLILLDYRKNPDIFSQEARKIIYNSQIEKEELKWEDHNKVIERLNAPELLDFYINSNIRYDHIIPCFHRSPRSVIKEKYGDCDDLAYFGRTVLTKAGYDVFGRIVGAGTVCHIGLGIKLEDGSYFLAVHFNRSRNHMSGPYKTILELDKALGYGNPYYPPLRGPFNFNW